MSTAKLQIGSKAINKPFEIQLAARKDKSGKVMAKQGSFQNGNDLCNFFQNNTSQIIIEDKDSGETVVLSKRKKGKSKGKVRLNPKAK